MFSSRLPLSVLIELCRSLRHYLGAGLSLVDVFKQQAKRGPAAIRPLADRVASELEGGSSLNDALEPDAKRFPPLFLSLANVGERTGMLPEIFGELERFFLRQKELRQKFIARIAWPVIQFVLAVFVVALVIFVLGQLGSVTPTGQPYDPLGIGLSGGTGAVIFISVVFGTIAAIFGVYWVLSNVLGGRDSVSRFILGLPMIGPCMQALALGRFCLALRLTTESGMSIGKALRLSFRATGNPAYAASAPVAERTVRDGDDLTLALTRTNLFPDDILRIIAVAEESGSLTDVLRHQGDHYHEEASRWLALLTSMAGYGVWAMVAIFIITAIFRIYMSYLKMFDSLGI